MEGDESVGVVGLDTGWKEATRGRIADAECIQ